MRSSSKGEIFATHLHNMRIFSVLKKSGICGLRRAEIAGVEALHFGCGATTNDKEDEFLIKPIQVCVQPAHI